MIINFDIVVNLLFKMDIYHLFILFISIGLIESASIQAEEHKRKGGRVFKGGDCEYIMISGITANTGCDSGNKFVIKQQTGVRQGELEGGRNLLYGIKRI